MKKQAKPPETVRILFTRSADELFVDAPVVYRNGPLAVVPRYRVRTDSNPTVFDVVPKEFVVVHAASGFSAHEPVAMRQREAELACDALTKLDWPALIAVSAKYDAVRAKGEVDPAMAADLREHSRRVLRDMTAALERGHAAWKIEATAATVKRREVRETNAAARLKVAVDAWLAAGGWAGDKSVSSEADAHAICATLPVVKGCVVKGYRWLPRSGVHRVATLSYPVKQSVSGGVPYGPTRGEVVIGLSRLGRAAA